MGNGVIQLVDLIHLQRLPVVGLEEHGWFRFGVIFFRRYTSRRPLSVYFSSEFSQLLLSLSNVLLGILFISISSFRFHSQFAYLWTEINTQSNMFVATHSTSNIPGSSTAV